MKHFNFKLRSTLVSVPANTDTKLCALGIDRKYLSFKVVSGGPVLLGVDAPPNHAGDYSLAAPPSAGTPGGSLLFENDGAPTNVFYGFATADSVVSVWEGV